MLSAAELRGRASSVSASHTVILRLLGGAVGSLCASTVPAACSDKSSPAVRGRAHRTRLPRRSERLCPMSVELYLSALFTGEELWTRVPPLVGKMDMVRFSRHTVLDIYSRQLTVDTRWHILYMYAHTLR